jgi:hypothetical protein
MSGGGSKTEYVTTQSNTGAPAYAQPFLEYGLEQARDQFDSSQPEYFPGQTFVDFSPQTEQALRQTETRALTGSPLQQGAVDQAMATVRGDYLGAANPYRDQAIQSAMEPVISSVSSAFSGGNRFNSGLFADALAKRSAEVAGNIGYADYGRERGLQQAMVGAAPGLAQSDYADIGQLMNVGSAREGMAQQALSDQVNRFNFEQNLPASKLNQYMAAVRGGTVGQTGTQTQPVFSNPTANTLGALSTIAGIGSMAFAPPTAFGGGGFLRGLV